ncbi:hypothetical protein [Kordiimonas sp.]|uniref:hypothetical protein n=1 Tax=Kordiimonas sp. TaxID=1970157 RepID=UPI003A912563
MINRLFNWLDWGCDAFLKVIVLLLFLGGGLFLAVAGGTFGVCLFLVIASFLKWAMTDSRPADAAGEEEA